MAEPFIGEIKMFAGNFAPLGWAFCDGQLASIPQNDALFSLLGTIYGGDGRTTFGLPDMRGRIPLHAGTGPGLSPRALGSKGGAETETITQNQLPGHTHQWYATSGDANQSMPTGNLLATAGQDLYGPPNNLGNLAAQAISNTGGSQPHDNVMPFLCVNFIIALFGIYPSRT